MKYLKQITWKLWASFAAIFVIALISYQSGSGFDLDEVTGIIIMLVVSIVYYIWPDKK